LFEPRKASETVSQGPSFDKVGTDTMDNISFDVSTNTLTVVRPLTDRQAKELEASFSSPEDKETVRKLCRRSHAIPSQEPSVSRPIVVPTLCIPVHRELQFLEESHFIDVGWDLSKADDELSDELFPSEVEAGTRGEIDVTEGGKIESRRLDEVKRRLTLLRDIPDWTVAGLVNWLDRNIAHPDLTRTQATMFIKRVVERLMRDRELSVSQLARERYRLAESVEALIDTHRRAMREVGYQKTLFGPAAKELVTSPEQALTIDDAHYAPNAYDDSGHQFQKHAFPRIARFDSHEEFECAQFIDGLPNVSRWVRNLARRPHASFSLPTTTDRFYPDFVVELVDGRILVVEYKGEHLWSADDAKEKTAVGELWADRSDGRCLFVMPKGRDWQAIRDAIESS